MLVRKIVSIILRAPSLCSNVVQPVAGSTSSGSHDIPHPLDRSAATNPSQLPEAQVEPEVFPQPPPQLTAPGPEEQRLHRLTHVPYKAWCSHCVSGRGRDAAHHRSDTPVPLVELDFAFTKFLQTEQVVPVV